jgi:hypothetical protein
MRLSWTLIKEWASVIFMIALIIVPLGLLLWLVFATNIFTVQAITVLDARPQTETQVRQVITDQLKTVPRQNIFFLQTDSVAGSILSSPKSELSTWLANCRGLLKPSSKKKRLSYCCYLMDIIT